MPGRPLKTPETRINNHAPTRGEWVDLEPLAEPVLPAYPIDWYRRDMRAFAIPKRTWDLWRQDPVTSQWAPGDIALVLELGERYWRMKDPDRLRIMTYLGLNARGRRDLRWREPVETESAKKADAHAAEVRRLRIVHEPETEQE
jgi:hypothetical protein